jgi:hypothetical protein
VSRRSHHGRPQPPTLAGDSSPARSEVVHSAPAATAQVDRESRGAARQDADPARGSWDAAPENASGLGPAAAAPAAAGDNARNSCTQAQLRRFIKSRPWIPMHELRRRFGIPGGDDDVTAVRTMDGTIFIGLPANEGRMLGELLNSGDVGYELSLDPGAPIVVGVYPMRPVPRG